MNAVKTKDTALDIGIDGECPICAKNRDPETGEPLYNAVTLAAFEEAKAIMRGEIPAKRYSSLEEAWKDLDL